MLKAILFRKKYKPKIRDNVKNNSLILIEYSSLLSQTSRYLFR